MLRRNTESVGGERSRNVLFWDCLWQGAGELKNKQSLVPSLISSTSCQNLICGLSFGNVNVRVVGLGQREKNHSLFTLKANVSCGVCSACGGIVTCERDKTGFIRHCWDGGISPFFRSVPLGCGDERKPPFTCHIRLSLGVTFTDNAPAPISLRQCLLQQNYI